MNLFTLIRSLKLIFFVCILLITGPVAAQVKTGPGAVLGRITDSTNQSPLQYATVSILNISDSTEIAAGFSKQDGSFSVKDVPLGDHLLKVTFQGYQTIQINFSLTSKATSKDFGSLFLLQAPNNLGEVIVTSTPTVAVRGDTTEFNAAKFQTKPNATAEDLLKKLPGMEVDKEGEVKAQGEVVTKILVDGKPFFGKDPLMATRNLPVDIIDKIQVIDAMSDQAVFSGFDDGVQEKVINIITKKDRRKGYFGKASASVGNDGRYGSDVNISRFNGDRKITLVGKANNTSQENLSIQELLNVVNSGGFGKNGFGDFNSNQGGIARNYVGGLNYNDAFSDKTTVSGSYHHDNSNSINQSKSIRETFVTGDSSLFNNRLRYTNNRNIRNSLNFEVEHKFDSSNSLLIRPSYSYNKTNNFSESNSSITRGMSAVEKEVRTVNNTLNTGSNFNNTMLFRHRFAKRGRTVSINYDQAVSNNQTDRKALNYTANFKNGTIDNDTTNRLTDINRSSSSHSVSVSYTEPVGINGQVELKYVFSNGLNNSDQSTRNLNSLTGKYDLIDTALSNQFKNHNSSRRGGITYRSKINKLWNYNVGLDVQQVELVSDNQTKNRLVTQTFTNYMPSAFLQYRKSRTDNFRIAYRGNNRTPGIEQLQDVVDNSNPLNIRTGNPALKQEFSNNINIRYTKVNSRAGTNFIVRVNGNFVQNKITNSVTINSSQTAIMVDNISLDPLAQYTKPVNLNGFYSLNGYVNYGFPLIKDGLNLNLTTDLSHNRNINLINDVKGFTNNYALGQTVRLTMTIKEKFDMNFSSTSTYNMARYSLKPGQNGNYFKQVFSIEPTYYTKTGWIIESDFDYTKTTGQAQGYNQSFPLWNASLSKQLLKNKRALAKISVFDILNQNQSFRRTVDQNYIEDVQSTVLKRYFLLTFTYNLRQFGGNKERRRRN